MLVEIFTHMELCTESEVARMLPLVSAQRRDEALRYAHTHGRFCCLKSYMMLLELLGAVSPTLDYTRPVFTYNAYGKPAIQNRPDLHFSISHTKNAIAVAVSFHPVGIDIEQLRLPSDALIRKTMNEDERRRIASADNSAAAFTALWTQKEAVLKCAGTGIIDNLHDVLLAPHATLIQTQINMDNHYACSVAQNNSASSNESILPMSIIR